ncbi:MAG: hypothetical protein RL223_1161 [Pseudomonadota bacterium]|jgi:hypothetical protein
MSDLFPARTPVPARLKVSLLSLPPRTQAVMEYFMAGAGRAAFMPVAATSADAAIFDHDHPDSRQQWEDFHRAYGRPGILLSVNPQEVPDTVWVQKPATPAALMAAAARLASITAGRGAAAVAPPPVALPPGGVARTVAGLAVSSSAAAATAASVGLSPLRTAALRPILPPGLAGAAVPPTAGSTGSAGEISGLRVASPLPGPAAAWSPSPPPAVRPPPVAAAPLPPSDGGRLLIGSPVLPLTPAAPATPAASAAPMTPPAPAAPALRGVVAPPAAQPVSPPVAAPAPTAADLQALQPFATPAVGTPRPVAGARPLVSVQPAAGVAASLAAHLAAQAGQAAQAAQATPAAPPATHPAPAAPALPSRPSAAVNGGDPAAVLAASRHWPDSRPDSRPSAAGDAPATQPPPRRIDPAEETRYLGDRPDVSPEALKSEPAAFFSRRNTLLDGVSEAWRMARKAQGLAVVETAAGMLIFDATTNRVHLTFELGRVTAMCVAVYEIPLRVRSFSARELSRLQHEGGKVAAVDRADTLLWRIALLTSRGRLPEGIDPTAPLYLQRWPNATRLTHTPEALRVIAMLAVKGGSAVEVAQALEVPQRYVFACCAGLAALDLLSTDAKLGERRQRRAQPKGRSIFTRLLRWLRVKD